MALDYGTGGTISVSMEGPFGSGGGGSVKITEVTLLSANWKGAVSPYSQIVEIADVSVNSMVNLHPSVEQLEIFHDKDLAFTTENEGGVVTVFAIGDKPQNDYTIQASVMEVVV